MTSENYADQCARCITERALLEQANHELVFHNQFMLLECEHYRAVLRGLLDYVTRHPDIPLQHIAILKAEQALEE